MLIASTGSATSAASGTSNIGLQDFLKILLTQLTYQDPLKPMDNQAFLAQMAQFTSLQQTQAMNTSMQTLVSSQASLQSVGLLGKTVDITTDQGLLTGTVTALSLVNDSPQVTVTPSSGRAVTGVTLAQIQAVR